MEIKERKYTTKKGLEALSNLINSLEDKLQSDIDVIESGPFNCRYDMATNQYQYLYSYTAFWRIKGGEIYLIVDDYEDKDIYFKSKIVKIEYIERIDFKSAIEELEKLLDVYNNLSLQKDKEIENFLNFCKNYNK